VIEVVKSREDWSQALCLILCVHIGPGAHLQDSATHAIVHGENSHHTKMLDSKLEFTTYCRLAMLITKSPHPHGIRLFRRSNLTSGPSGDVARLDDILPELLGQSLLQLRICILYVASRVLYLAYCASCMPHLGSCTLRLTSCVLHIVSHTSLLANEATRSAKPWSQ